MLDYILIIPIVVSFLITFFLIPAWIKKAKEIGLVGKDMHKINEVEVAESGGVIVVVGFSFALLIFIAINTFILDSDEYFVEMLALLATILLISFIAFTDDILGWKMGLRRRTRLILVGLASIPLVAINAGKSIVSLPFFGVVDLGVIYPLVLIPLGIIGSTTTFNFLAGYNGLEAGLGILVLVAESIVCLFLGKIWLFIISLSMCAALIAFLFYNKYPAKIFPGDTLTYSVGGLIASIAILGNFEKIAVFFFIPYIIETGLKIRGGLIKQSFGKPNKEGNLDLLYDKVYSLNHFAIFLIKKVSMEPTEKRVTLLIWSFQILVILLGFVIFRRGIF